MTKGKCLYLESHKAEGGNVIGLSWVGGAGRARRGLLYSQLGALVGNLISVLPSTLP